MRPTRSRIKLLYHCGRIRGKIVLEQARAKAKAELKAVLHENYCDAVNLAIEVWEKFKKLNHDWEG